MEEVQTKIKAFLQAICCSEQQTNQLLVQFNSNSDAAKYLFETFSFKNQQVSADDIATYYIQFSKQTQTKLTKTQIKQIISSYFKFPKHGHMKILQFRNTLIPRQQYKYKQQQDNQSNLSETFMKILQKIISGFKEVENIRQQLCNTRQLIQVYFTDKYQSSERITKQLIRDFMYDQGMYTKQKFDWIIWYIFGVNLEAIEWDLFLSKFDSIYGQNQENDCCPTILEQWNGDNSNSDNIKSIKQINDYLIEQSGANNEQQIANEKTKESVNQILAQIQELQRKMQTKRTKRSSRNNLKQQNAKNYHNFIQKQQKNCEEQKQNNSIFYKTTIKYSEQPKYCNKSHQKQIHYTHHNHSNSNRTHCLFNKNYQQSDLAYRFVNHQAYDRYSSNKYSSSKSKKINKSSSQAQLKIQQIQRKVNKMMGPKYKNYLTSSIQSNFVPISKYDVSNNNTYKDDYRYDVSKYDNRIKQIIYRKGSDTHLTARTNLKRYLI